ncbi:hypothetical protein KMW28_27330 [Flammeovirga yaeyamensis]|uniref:Uncharacterized protein n=1 Tax=Flammeovirga yaeyamensis TaxID=367791 RepID=A0AAX1NAL5_9BACT|nr:hypothetical protein [Flammeovirga yaeyamensis]MBB3700005.1 hypothetical protein [Flammeovirga yaeyamensis]NMF37557.1 hypothetical protein [Flammeovirga yaeyamensis]QWG04614.1 hypothetical protein KMW28_27330 [Flammeovirga yaeyamensis]
MKQEVKLRAQLKSKYLNTFVINRQSVEVTYKALIIISQSADIRTGESMWNVQKLVKITKLKDPINVLIQKFSDMRCIVKAELVNDDKFVKVTFDRTCLDLVVDLEQGLEQFSVEAPSPTTADKDDRPVPPTPAETQATLAEYEASMKQHDTTFDSVNQPDVAAAPPTSPTPTTSNDWSALASEIDTPSEYQQPTSEFSELMLQIDKVLAKTTQGAWFDLDITLSNDNAGEVTTGITTTTFKAEFVEDDISVSAVDSRGNIYQLTKDPSYKIQRTMVGNGVSMISNLPGLAQRQSITYNGFIRQLLFGEQLFATLLNAFTRGQLDFIPEDCTQYNPAYFNALSQHIINNKKKLATVTTSAKFESGNIIFES